MSGLILRTWVAANFLLLLYIIARMVMMDGGNFDYTWSAYLLLFLFICFLISCPSLLLGYICLKWINRQQATADQKFIAWLCAQPLVIWINILALQIIAPSGSPLIALDHDTLVIVYIPSVIICSCIAGFLYKSFMRAFATQELTIDTENEPSTPSN